VRVAHHADARVDVPVSSQANERALVLDCRGERLVAVISLPREHVGSRGMLILVGGPQYRAGSHRQFTLLARRVAAAGIPCMRFDYRGMGDSSGDMRTFEDVEEDVQCALEVFLQQVPELEQLVLWGLCDAASAALLFGVKHPRVHGVVLLNPWVRSNASLSQARIRHYYRKQLFSGVLWRKVLRGEMDWVGSWSSLVRTVRNTRSVASAASTVRHDARAQRFQDRMAEGLRRFSGSVLLVLSGNDLTAKEFIDWAAQDPIWRQACAREGVSRVDVPQADHTFSRRAWQAAVEQSTLAWLHAW
jgi:uncharacterized protein